MLNRSLNVLLVCSDSNWTKFVVSVLESLGHSVKQAESFEEGEREVVATNYDLVIVDCPFSNETRYQTCIRIRAAMKTPHFIVSSWDLGPREIEQLMKLQVADWVRKGIERNERIRQLKDVVTRSQAELTTLDKGR